MIVKVEKDCEGILTLLSKDIQPKIEYQVKDYDEIHIELASVFNWLDILNQLTKQFFS